MFEFIAFKQSPPFKPLSKNYWLAGCESTYFRRYQPDAKITLLLIRVSKPMGELESQELLTSEKANEGVSTLSTLHYSVLCAEPTSMVIAWFPKSV